VGQLSLLANNSVADIPKVSHRSLVADDNINFSAVSIRAGGGVVEKGDVKVLRAAWVGYQARQVNAVPDHTRGVVGHRRAFYLQQQQLEDFNIRFRALPAEVRNMIIGFAIEWDGKKTPRLIVGLRTTQNNPDLQLYKVALRAFNSQYTFVLTQKNSYTMNPQGKDAMLPVVWEEIRNLEIKYE
jgi:hypothetical protein